ncbi:MAG TPA: hypothetical protein VHA78_00830 [Candidatus Peribacteraceae bacterium]|nr:hypothetical protein [Candidatus Peribacteraceae bacterium]
MSSSRIFILFSGALLLTACSTTPPDNTTGSGNVACTMEAKLCPDGSYVGRVPPSCNFAPCPGTSSGSTASSSSMPQTVSDNTISFSVPSDFALAVQGEAIQKPSYIPPCNDGFTYCLYYTGNQYQGTNFESAGLSIVKRTDLTTKNTCLTRQPDGYTSITPVTHEGTTYATSVFAPLGDAAMGHYAQDQLYRLSVGSSCYEFRTRIGSTQFANYPPGTIKEFSTSDEATLQASLDSILHGITLKDGTSLTFPAAPTQS